MTGRAGHVLVHARLHCLFHLDMAILARGLALDMPHASRPVLVAINTYDFFRHVHVLGQARGLGEIPAEIAVPSPALHGPRVAHKGAPSAAGAIFRGRYAAHGMRAALARGRVVAIKAAGVADVARLLLRYRLLVAQRQIDLIDDQLSIFEGEPVTFRPADRLGVREGRPSVIRAVNIVPDAHGALPEVRTHIARRELLHLFRMAT
jgi:hypothetical protein